MKMSDSVIREYVLGLEEKLNRIARQQQMLGDGQRVKVSAKIVSSGPRGRPKNEHLSRVKLTAKNWTQITRALPESCRYVVDKIRHEPEGLAFAEDLWGEGEFYSKYCELRSRVNTVLRAKGISFRLTKERQRRSSNGSMIVFFAGVETTSN